MKVATKLGLSYGLVVALLGVVLAGLVYSLERAADGSRRLASASDRLVTAATDQRVRLDRLQEAGLKFGITRDSGYARRFAEMTASFDSSLAAYRGSAGTEAETEAAASLADEWERFRARWTPIEAHFLEGQPGAGDESAFTAAVEELRSRNRELVSATRSTILSAVGRTSARARRSESFAWQGVALALLLAGIVWLVLVRSITRALGRLLEGTRRVAAGDFSVRLDADREDEFGQLADAFDRMTGRLEELDQVKKDFLSKVSHDLKSPLATMREVHRFLLDGGAGRLEAKQRDLLERNEEHGERLSRMITTLLDVARFEGDSVELASEPCDLAGLAGEVRSDVLPRFERADVDLELATDAPLEVEADRERLRQVLENLLDNALSVSSAGDSVRLEVRIPEGNGAGASIAVADRGPGVPDEEKEAVFERFFQGVSRDRGSGGTGLGLTLCRRIVEAHGGEIRVEDREGGGALFRVRLPRRPGAEGDAA